MRFLALVASFILVAFGQPYFSQSLSVVGAVFGFGLFFYFLPAFKKRYFVAASWYAAVQLVDLVWFCTPKYHGPMIFLVWLLVALALGAQFGLLTFCRRPVAAASLWTWLEFSRYFFFCGFPFSLSGLPWTASIYALQCVSLFGILGLSFWTIFVGMQLQLRRFKTFAVCAALPFVLGAALYYPRLARMEKHEQHLTACLVQTGLKQEQKAPLPGYFEDFISPLAQWGHLISLIPKGEKLDLIICPEAVIPFGARHPIYPRQESNLDFARGLQQSRGGDLLIGLDDTDAGGSYNAAFFLSDQEELRYEKRVLVPLGEYLPLAILRKVAAQYGLTQFFTQGKAAKVFSSVVPLSPTICYEECYPHLVRQGRRMGAELFVNLTNDGYYPNSSLPKVHFHYGLVRSVENGVPLLRACNTGVTASVDSLGRVVDKVEKEWARVGIITRISTYSYGTLYSLLGDYPLLLFSLFVLTSLSINRKRAKLDHC